MLRYTIHSREYIHKALFGNYSKLPYNPVNQDYKGPFAIGALNLVVYLNKTTEHQRQVYILDFLNLKFPHKTLINIFSTADSVTQHL